MNIYGSFKLVRLFFTLFFECYPFSVAVHMHKLDVTYSNTAHIHVHWQLHFRMLLRIYIHAEHISTWICAKWVIRVHIGTKNWYYCLSVKVWYTLYVAGSLWKNCKKELVIFVKGMWKTVTGKNKKQIKKTILSNSSFELKFVYIYTLKNWLFGNWKELKNPLANKSYSRVVEWLPHDSLVHCFYYTMEFMMLLGAVRGKQ